MSKDWDWKFYPENKQGTVIALVAPSNGVGGEDRQNAIKLRIDLLVSKGFCVMVPEYKDGALAFETEVENRITSQVVGNTICPATSPKSGSEQIIEAIENGWNIMPYMGGDSFQAKIPLIVEHFEKHPERKNPNVKIFGMSNTTYATILASNGICSFTSTPFTRFFVEAQSDPYFVENATKLEQAMKGERFSSESTIIQDPENKLSGLRETFHYPLNTGNVDWENVREKRIIKRFENAENTKTIEEIREEEERRSLKIEPSKAWSISMEGFLQRFDHEKINSAKILKDFLKLHEQHLPSFIEIGNLVTRYDGAEGYANLVHDNETGQILVNEYNIDKVYNNYKNALVKAEEARLEGRKYKLPIIPLGIDISTITKDSVREILTAQNALQEEIMNEIKADVGKVPLTQNTQNGHCLNMGVVEGGESQILVHDGKMTRSAKRALENPSATVSDNHTSSLSSAGTSISVLHN